ncbi:uncharacterized protein [Diadema setosum]|uniref:uncharacterized protein n=1 Tax=Diadema setosum TaxID=31175 RepID=UPI003B3A548D
MADRDNRRGWYDCRKCGKDYRERRSLDFHLRKVHGIYRGREFKCQECDYIGSKLYNLKRHVGFMHSGKRDQSSRRDRSPLEERGEKPRFPTSEISMPSNSDPPSTSAHLLISSEKPVDITRQPQADLSPAVLSVAASPTPLSVSTPSSPGIHVAPPPQGKPRAMLLRAALENGLSSADDSDNDEDPGEEPTPTPREEKDQVVALVVEKTCVCYYIGGEVVRQVKQTDTYRKLVPKSWDLNNQH